VAFLALSPRHAHAARALIVDAMHAVEKIQRTSRDAYYADEARESIQQALEHLLKGDTEQSVDFIRSAESRLGHYLNPTEQQKRLITPQDGRLAKRAVAHLFNARVKILTAKPRPTPTPKPRHADIRRTGYHPYDDLIADPELRSAALAKRYARDLKKIGPGTDVAIEIADSLAPRGWVFGNFTELTVTPRGGAPKSVTFRLNAGQDEASGIAFINQGTPHSIPVQARARTPQEVVSSMVSEIIAHLKPRRG
jgi:hypothetical protein